jgi:hypothetical protein
MLIIHARAMKKSSRPNWPGRREYSRRTITVVDTEASTAPYGSIQLRSSWEAIVLRGLFCVVSRSSEKESGAQKDVDRYIGCRAMASQKKDEEGVMEGRLERLGGLAPEMGVDFFQTREVVESGDRRTSKS